MSSMTDEVDAPAGFDLAAHARYVERGGCPFVEFKTYCNDQAGHAGAHWAHYLLAPGRTVKQTLHTAKLYRHPASPARYEPSAEDAVTEVPSVENP